MNVLSNSQPIHPLTMRVKESKAMYKERKLLSVPYYLWILLFVIAPVFLLLYQSVQGLDGNFTLSNIQTYFTSPVYLNMTLQSFLYAFLITFLALLISYPAAYFLTRTKHKQLWLLVLI